jgi:hypothetical protein
VIKCLLFVVSEIACLALSVVLFAIVSLHRLYVNGKLKRNLSTVAVTCVAISYMQMSTAQFFVVGPSHFLLMDGVVSTHLLSML